MRQSKVFFSQTHRGFSLGEGLLVVLIVVALALGAGLFLRNRNPALPVSATFANWYRNKPGYDRALADQALTKRPVLLYIYASWCPHCQEFTAQVLNKPPVTSLLMRYPHVKVAPDDGAAEKQIMTDFGAQGYPSFYVVLPNQEHRQVDTFILGDHPRQKTPEEFKQSLLEATGGV